VSNAVGNNNSNNKLLLRTAKLLRRVVGTSSTPPLFNVTGPLRINCDKKHDVGTPCVFWKEFKTRRRRRKLRKERCGHIIPALLTIGQDMVDVNYSLLNVLPESTLNHRMR
jgi:hypothetical protein